MSNVDLATLPEWLGDHFKKTFLCSTAHSSVNVIVEYVSEGGYLLRTRSLSSQLMNVSAGSSLQCSLRISRKPRYLSSWSGGRMIGVNYRIREHSHNADSVNGICGCSFACRAPGRKAGRSTYCHDTGPSMRTSTRPQRRPDAPHESADRAASGLCAGTRSVAATALVTGSVVSPVVDHA